MSKRNKKKRTINGRRLTDLLVTYDDTCVYCSRKVVRWAHVERETFPMDGATCDHFIPISSGGIDHIRNMVLSCRKCNDEKANVDPRQVLLILGEPHASKLIKIAEELIERAESEFWFELEMLETYRFMMRHFYEDRKKPL